MQQTRQCLIRLVDLLQRYILGDRQLFVMVHLGSPLYNIRILLTVPFASGTGAAIARTSTSTPVRRAPSMENTGGKMSSAAGPVFDCRVQSDCPVPWIATFTRAVSNPTARGVLGKSPQKATECPRS